VLYGVSTYSCQTGRDLLDWTGRKRQPPEKEENGRARSTSSHRAPSLPNHLRPRVRRDEARNRRDRRHALQGLQPRLNEGSATTRGQQTGAVHLRVTPHPPDEGRVLHRCLPGRRLRGRGPACRLPLGLDLPLLREGLGVLRRRREGPDQELRRGSLQVHPSRPSAGVPRRPRRTPKVPRFTSWRTPWAG